MFAFSDEPHGFPGKRPNARRNDNHLSRTVLLGEVLGAHVLVHRGGCSFFAKAKAIDNAGGGSLIVIDAGAGRLRMEAEREQHVDIPVSMVSKLDGEQDSHTCSILGLDVFPFLFARQRPSVISPLCAHASLAPRART